MVTNHSLGNTVLSNVSINVHVDYLPQALHAFHLLRLSMVENLVVAKRLTGLAPKLHTCAITDFLSLERRLLPAKLPQMS